MTMYELIRLSEKRNKAARELLSALREDAKIADHIKSHWANLNCGSERRE